MNWDNVRYFIAVAEQKSVAGAARHLGVKHPTVLRHIDAFEKQMETKLFNRLASGYKLTSAGKKILNSALQMEGITIDMQRALKGLDNQASGVINVTVPNWHWNKEVARFLTDFSSRYSDITLNVDSATDQRNVEQLESDVALRATNSPPDNLLGRHIGTISYVPVVHRRIWHQKKSPEDYQWVLPLAEPSNIALASWINNRLGSLPVAVRTNDMSVATEFVDAACAACIMPASYAEEHNYQVIVEPSLCYSLDVWLLTHKDYRGIKRTKILMDFLTDQLQSIMPSPK